MNVCFSSCGFLFRRCVFRWRSSDRGRRRRPVELLLLLLLRQACPHPVRMVIIFFISWNTDFKEKRKDGICLRLTFSLQNRRTPCWKCQYLSLREVQQCFLISVAWRRRSRSPTPCRCLLQEEVNFICKISLFCKSKFFFRRVSKISSDWLTDYGEMNTEAPMETAESTKVRDCVIWVVCNFTHLNA